MERKWGQVGYGMQVWDRLGIECKCGIGQVWNASGNRSGMECKYGISSTCATLCVVNSAPWRSKVLMQWPQHIVVNHAVEWNTLPCVIL